MPRGGCPTRELRKLFPGPLGSRAVKAPLLVIVLLLTPATLANTMTPTLATPLLASSDIYAMDLVAGTPVTLSLSWDDPLADLDVSVVPPRAPECEYTQTDCLAYIAVEIGTGALCPVVPGEFGAWNFGLGPYTERLSLTAPATGTYQIWVIASTAVPGKPIEYSLDVDGGEPRDPFQTYVSVGSPHCKYVHFAQETAGLTPGSPI